VGGSNPITVSGTYGVSEGSTVVVPAATIPSSSTVTAISVNFSGLNVTNLNSVAMVLESPGGTSLDLLSGVCDSTNANFTLADTGATGSDNVSGMVPFLGGNCPSALSGTYLASDWYAGQDTFSSPGPSSYDSAGSSSACAGVSTTCGTYNFTTAFGLPASGSSVQGTWTLYIANQSPSGFTPSGLLGSWTITFTVESSTAPTTTTISANPNGQSSTVFTSGNVGGQSETGTTVTLTATVSPSPSGGTVSFYDSTFSTAGSGILLASGVPVSGGQAQTTVVFPPAEEGPRTISAVYSGTTGYAGSTTPSGSEATVLTVNQPYNPSGATFCNGPVTINNSSGAPAAGTGGYPYASQLVLGNSLSQLQGTIESVTVTLNGLQTEDPQFLGFLLQGPNSANGFEFMSWADGTGGSANSPPTLTNLNLTLADNSSGSLQTNTDNQADCSTSACEPADDYSQIGPLYSDTFPSPAPSAIGRADPAGSATFLSQFGGQSANGTWQLYLNNWLAESASTNASLPYGQLNSWCLNFTMQANAHPTTTSASGSPNPASFIPPATNASVNLTANVAVSDGSGIPVNAGTVTFVDGATNLGSAPVANGQATLAATLTEGTHQIVASYSGTNTGTEFGVSSATFDQRVDTATALPTSVSGAGPYSYCNTGSITAPGLGLDSGPASPYPSNIFVTNLPGTVNAATVTLNGFSTRDQGDLLSLLVGPGGNNLDFFSLTGSNVGTAPAPFNLNFSDTAADIVSGNLSSAGTFQPTSNNPSIAYPQCPPNASDCASPPVGPPLASNPFTPTHKAAPAGTSILGNANEEGVFGGTTFSTYDGNGAWSLYMDDGGPTGGGEMTNVSGGWCVNLTVNQPVVSASVSASDTFSEGQQGAPLTVEIGSTGPGSTGDPTGGSSPMTVTDTLNSAFTYAGFSGTGWSCSATGQTVNCTNDSAVANGSSYPQLTINVNVASTATGPVTNQVSASGAGAASTSSNTDTVTIDVPPAITSAGSTTFTVAANGSFTVRTTGTPTPSISESGTLPNGVTFIDNGNGTAALAGVPAAGTGGVYPFTITAQNGATPNATQSFTLTVDQSPAITSANGTTFNGGFAGSFTITTTGYPTAALSESGPLPSTVTLTDNGNGTATLAGTATSANSFPITITANNGVSPNAQQSFTLTVNSVATALTSPSPGSTLTGPSATFVWTAGSGATSYTLWLGSNGVGSNNIWGSGATTATSVTFTGLPTNGETIYARLFATVNGVSKHYDYTFTAATAAVLTSPAVGSTLLGTSATFKWTAPAGATAYALWLGSNGVGSNNLWGSGTTAATSVTFNGLPINGETIYARLFTTFSGVSVHTDFTYTAVAAAVLTSPTPNNTLPGPSATFQWTAPTGASAYTLWLGSSGVGSNNLWGTGSTTATSVTFGGLPINGETIYARLFSTVNGLQLHTDFIYTAASVALLTSPSPNSTLAGPTTTFMWTAPTGATAYTLWLGSAGVGSNNLVDSGSTTATSATFGGLPVNGETIYARLYTTLNGFKLHADFTYTAATAAVLTSPSPTSTLAGPSATFQWTPSTGATAYTLWLGSAGVGSNNVWSSGSTTSTSATFSALPTNGETLYARLFTTLGGVSVHTDTTYTAATAAVLTSPTPSSTFTGTSETFTWTAVSNASQYSIWVGTSVGSNNLGYTQGGTTSTFFTLNNLPTNGETIHVRLYTNYPGGGLAHNDYTFTAYTAVTGIPVTHTIQISNDADDGYYNNDDGSGWHSDPQAGGADWVGSWSGTTQAWVTGYRFESTGINSGDTIQSAYLQLWSSDGFATSSACGGAPCASSNSTFRVYGVAEDDGPAFSNATGNTPLDVPYTTSYTDYTTTGPGDDHGSCQGQNNGQNTCTHTIDVTAIVNEITSRPGWTNTSSMRFVMLSTDPTAPSVYAGFEDFDANASKAATLAVNPQTPTIVSSGAFGTEAQITYPTTYEAGPFVYQGASTLLLFLGDYYNFYGQVVDQPTVTDNCGNTWNILAGPTDWMGMIYDMRSTVYFVQSPASCSGGDTITVTADNQEPIFLHFLAIAGSDTTQAPVVSAITSPSPSTYTSSATSNSVTLANGGLLVSWIFGDSDSPTTFTPPTGFVTDPNSTPTYLTAVSEGVSSGGSYQSQFAISPSDGWQVVTIGFSAPTP
jgi:hypothetical protein